MTSQMSGEEGNGFCGQPVNGPNVKRLDGGRWWRRHGDMKGRRLEHSNDQISEPELPSGLYRFYCVYG